MGPNHILLIQSKYWMTIQLLSISGLSLGSPQRTGPVTRVPLFYYAFFFTTYYLIPGTLGFHLRRIRIETLPS